MGETEKLENLITFCLQHNRICPVPVRWHELYTILGRPRALPPLILSGWNFSSERTKRTRFREQLEYSSRCGLLEVAETFLRALPDKDWHTCAEAHLDWNYSDAMLEDESRRKKAIANAAKALGPALRPSESRQALGGDNLAQTMLLYHLLFPASNWRLRVDQLKDQIEKYAELENKAFSLMDDIDQNVANALRDLATAKSIELVLSEILCCMDEAGLPLDRDVIEDFVTDIFDSLEA